MTTAEINAYLDWRAEREGKTIDVSPEAYERDYLISAVLEHIRTDGADPEFDAEHSWDRIEVLVDEIHELEKEN